MLLFPVSYHVSVTLWLNECQSFMTVFLGEIFGFFIAFVHFLAGELIYWNNVSLTYLVLVV